MGDNVQGIFGAIGEILCKEAECYKNCQFRKFKMADGRHFENRSILMKFGTLEQILNSMTAT